MKRFSRLVGYAAFFFVFFLLGCYWMFPWHRLRDRIIAEVEYPAAKRGKPSGMTLSIGELSPFWLTGVVLDDVVVGQVPIRGKGETWSMALEEVNARVSPLSLLTGGLSGSFAAEVGDGELDGDFDGDFVETRGKRSFALRHLTLDIEELPLNQLGALRKYVTLPMKGTLAAEVDLSLPEDIKLSEGSIDAEIKDLIVGDGKAGVDIPGLSDPFVIESVRAGNLDVDIAIDKGVAEIKEFDSDGKDLALTVKGNIALAPNLGRSQLNLDSRVAFSEKYKKRNDATKALFTLIKFNQTLKKAQTKDGALQYSLKGALAKPKPIPAPKKKF